MRSFGINAWIGHEAGATLIPNHAEESSGHEELYLVTAGRARFTVDGKEIDAPAGTIVLVRDPTVTRGAVARDSETTVVSAGAKPGEAYRPRAWEMNRDVFALLDSGNPAEAKRLLEDALERYEDRALLFYNLACAEALLGEADAALERLRAALEARPSLAENAREDPDLESLRGDPRFEQIVG